MLKIALFTILLYFGYRLLKKSIYNHTYTTQHSVYPSMNEGEMVLDPICNTYIVKNTSHTIHDGDTIYYFCSAECKDSFLTKR